MPRWPLFIRKAGVGGGFSYSPARSGPRKTGRRHVCAECGEPFRGSPWCRSTGQVATELCTSPERQIVLGGAGGWRKQAALCSSSPGPNCKKRPEGSKASVPGTRVGVGRALLPISFSIPPPNHHPVCCLCVCVRERRAWEAASKNSQLVPSLFHKLPVACGGYQGAEPMQSCRTSLIVFA